MFRIRCTVRCENVTSSEFELQLCVENVTNVTKPRVLSVNRANRPETLHQACYCETYSMMVTGISNKMTVPHPSSDANPLLRSTKSVLSRPLMP